MHGLLIARDESCSQDQPPDSLQTLGSFRRLFHGIVILLGICSVCLSLKHAWPSDYSRCVLADFMMNVCYHFDL